MKVIKLEDINLLDVGNTIGLVGNIWSGNDGISYVTLFPDFQEQELGELQVLEMDLNDWKKFIKQGDILETEILKNDNGNLKKVTVRKSARLIDTRVQWKVFQRDNYTCRYTGETGIPLSVDHIDLWEDGGATIEDNLLAVSRKANKLRGNMPYEEWIKSETYKRISKNLTEQQQRANLDILFKLDELRQQRVTNIRSR